MTRRINPTIRELTAHKVNGLNEALRIFVLDEPGSGNACHEYIVCVPTNPEADEPNVNWLDGIFYETSNGHGIMVAHGFAKITFESSFVPDDAPPVYYTVQRISFQNGPVKEAGYNGNSHEALLAILLDRLEGFQAGPYKCHDNEVALDHLQSARLWLHKRTMDRLARGVEGTHQK